MLENSMVGGREPTSALRGTHPSASGIRVVLTQRTIEVYETSHYRREGPMG